MGKIGIYFFFFLIAFGFINCRNTKRTTICNQEILPSTFNSLSYLDFNGEFEFFDSFIANYEWNTHHITFHLNETSAVRFYVAPKYSVDIDLWLYSNNTRVEYIQVKKRKKKFKNT